MTSKGKGKKTNDELILLKVMLLAVFYPGFFLREGENYLQRGTKTYFRGGGQKHRIRRKSRNSRGDKIDLRGGEKARAPSSHWIKHWLLGTTS